MDYRTALAIGLPIGLGLAALGSALGLGKAVAAAMEATGRQPEASIKILITMATGCAFIEALTIYALVFVFSLEVGLVAPPVGINIFVVQGIWKDAKFDEVVKGVLPFALLMILAISLVVYIKPLSTWLPRLIG